MNFVFTSAGNNTQFDKLWTGVHQKYDIYVVYYGDDESVFQRYNTNKQIKHCEKQKGSKFQNLIYFYKKYPHLFQIYDQFFILDDDIVFKVDDINRMFEMSRRYKLDICGPSFIKPSKISWNLTAHRENIEIAYTNFVEVNAMLFSQQALHNLIGRIMNAGLIEWGIDILAIWANGLYRKKAYAVIHSVKCINPREEHKLVKTKRELYNIKNIEGCIKMYANYVKKMGIRNELYHFIPTEYSCIKCCYNDMQSTMRWKHK